ncbi:hypothetical protein SNEBB_004465 [Seison nebaliae]|nr:hypothetical protein SNEBB_004465 [Seison nebaliae]
MDSIFTPNAKRLIKNRLFIGNLSQNTKEADIFKIFNKFGSIISINLICRKSSNKRAYGFVTFEYEQSVNKLLNEINYPIFLYGYRVNMKPAIQNHFNMPLSKAENLVIGILAKEYNLEKSQIESFLLRLRKEATSPQLLAPEDEIPPVISDNREVEEKRKNWDFDWINYALSIKDNTSDISDSCDELTEKPNSIDAQGNQFFDLTDKKRTRDCRSVPNEYQGDCNRSKDLIIPLQ